MVEFVRKTERWGVVMIVNGLERRNELAVGAFSFTDSGW